MEVDKKNTVSVKEIEEKVEEKKVEEKKEDAPHFPPSRHKTWLFFLRRFP